MFIVNIIGARPQFIKFASINYQLRNNFKKIKHKLIHTGQHYDDDMNNIFFRQFELNKPDYNLGIGGGSHGQNTGRMIENIEKILKRIKPDYVVVYGDTDTTLAGAISTSKLNIKLAHIEAGLRSNNFDMPEEINRRITDHCSDYLFASSQNSVRNLISEGISKRKIINSGDIMYDIFKLAYKKNLINKNLIYKYNLKENNYFYLTIHRKSNIDYPDNLSNIFNALSKINKKIIFPIHPNTNNLIKSKRIKIPKNIIKIHPVGYFENLSLQKFSSLIITDSGGIQKEAYYNKVYCITLREETEWIELVNLGVNTLVGTNEKKILKAINSKKNDNFPNKEIYGNGNSSKKILNKLIN